MSNHHAQVPGIVADYFGQAAREQHPTIAQTFTPGRGWVRTPQRKRVSVAWLRKIRHEGVTNVALDCAGRTADFTIAEILRHADRPLLGGRAI
jgi:hypothetical protein